MARALRPAKHLTQQQIDSVMDSAERACLIADARSTKKLVFLKGGPGFDTVDIQGQLVGSHEQSQLIARALLPFTDLIAGGVAYDQWLTAALVAAAENQFVNRQMRTDQVVVVYGVFTTDPKPHVSRVRLLNGTSVILAAWDTVPLWAAEDSIGYTDEFALWDVNQTINIQLMPYLAAPAGEVFGLLGFIAEPKGTGPVTK